MHRHDQGHLPARSFTVGNRRAAAGPPPEHRVLPHKGVDDHEEETDMYTIRPAVPEDREAIQSVAEARRKWLHDRRVKASHLAPVVMTDTAGVLGHGGEPLVWVCADEDGRLLGATRLVAASHRTQNGAARDEPSLQMSDLWTHPDTRSDRLSELMTLWTLSYAAELGLPLLTTRCPPPLVHHYGTRGWTLRTEVPLDTHGRHLLCRPARPAPAGLGLLIAEASRDPAALAPGGAAA